LKEEALQLSEEIFKMNETRKSLTDECFNIVNEYIKNKGDIDIKI